MSESVSIGDLSYRVDLVEDRIAALGRKEENLPARDNLAREDILRIGRALAKRSVDINKLQERLDLMLEAYQGLERKVEVQDNWISQTPSIGALEQVRDRVTALEGAPHAWNNWGAQVLSASRKIHAQPKPANSLTSSDWSTSYGITLGLCAGAAAVATVGGVLIACYERLL